MDAIWADLAEGVRGILGFITGTYGKGALIAGLLSLAIWACLEYVFVPIFRLPGLRRVQPTAHALRPLIATLIAVVALFRLHESGTVDFGMGPRGWLTAIIYGCVGGALTQPLHNFIKSKAPGLTVSSHVAPGAPIQPSGDGI